MGAQNIEQGILCSSLGAPNIERGVLRSSLSQRPERRTGRSTFVSGRPEHRMGRFTFAFGRPERRTGRSTFVFGRRRRRTGRLRGNLSERNAPQGQTEIDEKLGRRTWGKRRGAQRRGPRTTERRGLHFALICRDTSDDTTPIRGPRSAHALSPKRRLPSRLAHSGTPALALRCCRGVEARNGLVNPLTRPRPRWASASAAASRYGRTSRAQRDLHV